MSKDTYYFSHDYNARMDIKIKKLIAKHGLLGYGLFWAIVEDLYNNANALPTDYESIAFDVRSECELVRSVVNDFDLFVIEGSTFGSSSVERRLNERNERSSSAKRSADIRWEKKRTQSERNANALPPQSEGNAIKERKEKEKKEKRTASPFVPPSLEDVVSYFEQNGYSKLSATKAWGYYNSADWVDSRGTKIRSWKQKMQGVWFKPENESIANNVDSPTKYATLLKRGWKSCTTEELEWVWDYQHRTQTSYVEFSDTELIKTRGNSKTAIEYE